MGRKVRMIMFSTLDGIAEFPAYTDESPETWSDLGPLMWRRQFETTDTLILGRIAYEKWASYWPTAGDRPGARQFELDFSRFADRALKVVFSRTLTEASWGPSRIARGDLTEEMHRLVNEPGKDIAIGGGPRIAQALLDRDLVDELLLTVFPTVVGKGKPLWRVEPTPDNPSDEVPLGFRGRHDFRLLEVQPSKPGTVFLHYARNPKP